jgi:hypothetical protein
MAISPRNKEQAQQAQVHAKNQGTWLLRDGGSSPCLSLSLLAD